MAKVFISQGSGGKTDAAVRREQMYLKNVAEISLDSKCSFIDSTIEEKPPKRVNKSLWRLGKRLELMATAEVAVFAKDWMDYRSCRIEHDIALAYGIKIVEEKGEDSK